MSIFDAKSVFAWLTWYAPVLVPFVINVPAAFATRNVRLEHGFHALFISVVNYYVWALLTLTDRWAEVSDSVEKNGLQNYECFVGLLLLLGGTLALYFICVRLAEKWKVMIPVSYAAGTWSWVVLFTFNDFLRGVECL